GTGGAVRDLEKTVPDRLLKRAAGVNEGNAKPSEPAIEVEGQFFLELIEVAVIARHDTTLEAPAQGQDLRLQHAPVGELQETDPLGAGAGDERAERTLHPGHDNTIAAPTAAGRLAKRARECFPEAAVRLVAVLEDHFIQPRSLANLRECITHASSPAIGLKGHSIIP